MKFTEVLVQCCFENTGRHLNGGGFLLFCSVVVLKKLMKAKYFQHWLLLVKGIHLLPNTTVNHRKKIPQINVSCSLL